MLKPVTNLAYVNFRGMRKKYSLKLKGGKNLVLYAGNGKGKSSFVDGVEFVHCGELPRLSDRTLVKHIAPDGPEAYVELKLEGGTLRRNIDDGSLVASSEEVEDYLNLHPSTESFILRRPRLLDFMNAKPGERYIHLSGLVGLEWVQNTYDAFDRAVKSIKSDLEKAKGRVQSLYAGIGKGKGKRHPESKEDLLNLCCDSLEKAKLPSIANLQGELDRSIDATETLLKPEVQKRLHHVEKLLLDLELLPQWDLKERYEKLDSIRKDLRKVEGELQGVGQLKLVDIALTEFERSPHMAACPICERDFDEQCSYEVVLKGLRKRNKSMETLNLLMRDNNRETGQIKSSLIALGKEHSSVFSRIPAAFLSKDEQKFIERYSKSLEQSQQTMTRDDGQAPKESIQAPAFFETIEEFKSTLVERLEKEKKKLQRSSPEAIAKAYSTLMVVGRALPQIAEAEKEVKIIALQEVKAKAALKIFKQSSKVAFESVCGEIAGEVQRLYSIIHDDRDRSECSECSAVKMIPQSRGKGTLNFLIDFFGVVEGCNPLEALSEGHLDTLGLCIYLASVKRFNPSGSLLVLDDVLTSVDREHRHRITNLILDEFSDYQVILTTHDNVWFEDIKAKLVGARRKRWEGVEIGGWSLEEGPSGRPLDGAIAALEKARQEGALRYAGGPIRIVTEAFCAKTARAVRLEMPYRGDSPNYTTIDFVNKGLGEKLKSKVSERYKRLLKNMEEAFGELKEADKEQYANGVAEIQKKIDAIFTATFLNQLVHDKSNLEELSEVMLKDFTDALLDMSQQFRGQFLRDITQLP